MGIRRKGREAALQVLYQVDVLEIPFAQARELYWSHLSSSAEGEEFANSLLKGLADKCDLIDDKIRAVSHHWRLERMALVDRNILRLAIYELTELADIPSKVTLNEAIELAKQFGSEGSARFVNGVLDRVASDLGKA